MDSAVTAANGARYIRARFPDDAARANGGLYSIRGHFDGSCNVLLTGASGYIGSLVLEKLLRSTAVGHVYLLLRPRRGASPQERVAKLLQGPLFHMIDESHAARVTAVAGDITLPNLGLSPEDESVLVDVVDTVIHSAADIRLDAPILETLQANYLGSCKLATLAARMQRLRSFVYVSTCYVNINHPQGARVEERIYPLRVGGNEVDATGVAEELLALPEQEAEALAAKYISLWGFKNTYALGKHLAEKAVAGLQREWNLPLVIVRPSLVSGVAAEPYPGYAGNFAGQVGGAVAYLVGLYNDQPEAVASDGSSVWDVVPGDVVAHATIAAAAAAASPAARAHILAPLRTVRANGKTKNGQITGKAGDHDLGEAGDHTLEDQVLVMHVNSASVYPLTMADMFNDGVVFCTAHRRPFTLSLGRARGMDPQQRYNEAAWGRHMRSASRKVNALAWVLRLLGGKPRLRLARMLDAGLRTYQTINVIKYDLQLTFSADTLLQLEDCLAPEEHSDFRIVWRPPTSKAHLPSGAPAAKLVSLTASVPAGPEELAAPAPLTATTATTAGTAAAREVQLALAQQASREGGWTLFHYNVLAYLWKTIYGREVPPEARISEAAVVRLLPHLVPEQVKAATCVYHTFTAFS